MIDREPTMLLTRPEPQSSEFLARCEKEAGRQISAVISPLLQVVDVGEIPTLDDYRSLIFTSGQAVRRVGEAGLLKGRNVAVVGHATAELAVAYGALAKEYGRDSQTFLANCSDLAGPCLYLRGSHTRGDLATQLTAMGKMTNEAVVYDQISRPLTRAAMALISSQAPIVAPLFSPRTAQLLSRAIGQRSDIEVVAMSKAVADESEAIGEVETSAAPTVEAMCKSTLAKLQQAYLVERPADD
ncbi:MAG: uroporphyrinogen-III synthase [Boseongicola sp.]